MITKLFVSKDEGGLMKNGTKNGSGYIPVITKDRYYKINIADIDLIEQTSNKLRVVTSDRNEYEFRGTIDEIAPMLVGKSFFRVMKKLVINFDNVEYVSNYTLNFRSGITYGIGRNNFLKLRRAYKNYLFGYLPFIGRESGARCNAAEENLLDSDENSMDAED